MALTQTPAWHAAQESIERAWLDDWARHHTTLEGTPAPVPVLATAGSH